MVNKINPVIIAFTVISILELCVSKQLGCSVLLWFGYGGYKIMLE